MQSLMRSTTALCRLFGRSGQRQLNASMRCNFSSFPSKEQMRSEKSLGFTGFSPNLIFQDDLYFPMENSIHRKALDDLINHIKTHPNLTIEGRGLCTLLYLVAKNDRHEPFIFRELERHLYKFKETLSARLAFGGLYASLKSNCASSYMVSFFEEEFFRTSEAASAYDAIAVLQAMGSNTTKVREYKADYFTKSLRPVILSNFEKEIRPYNQNLNNLFLGLHNMEIYDEELFEKVLKYLPYRKGQTQVEQTAKLYEVLCEIKEKGLLKQDLDAHIAALEKRLSTRQDFKWRYNVEEKRHLTYDELIANRDNYKIEGQMQHKYRFCNPELIDQFNLVQSDKDAIKAEMEARERSRELENLVFEMFDLKNRGELSQSEDTSTLQGNYENVIFAKSDQDEEAEDENAEEGDENAEVSDEEADPEDEDDPANSLKSENAKSKSDKKVRKSHKLVQK